MPVLVAQLDEVLRPVVVSLGYELLGCEYLRRGQAGLLRLYIDKENGVDVEDCATVSRQVSAVLDAEDLIKSQYTLEVSSPGINRPLFTSEHFQRVVGQNIKVRLRVPQEGRRNFKGNLQSVVDNTVVLLLDGESVSLSMTNIEKANLIAEL